MKRRTFNLGLLAPVLAPSLALAQGGDYPTKPVKLVVPFPAGGATDLIARTVCQGLQERLGQTFVVENRDGAATMIGTSAVQQAQADGHTLLFTTPTTFSLNPFMFQKVNYKLEDFEPVGAVTSVDYAFVVRNDFPAKTFQEYVEYARKNPGKLNHATTGEGTMAHLAAARIAQRLGLDITFIHYRGASPATTAVMAGQVDSNVESVSVAAGNALAGKYRILSFMESRMKKLPSVPTITEIGYPELAGGSWFSMFAPAGTPAAAIAKLNGALNSLLSSPAFVSRAEEMGMIALPGTPAAMKTRTIKERESWGPVIEKLKIGIYAGKKS
ncbi:Bug family tripartite tricarboxylate transporter substrate binding protein [Ottowia thiooxydans]|uniref:Bug family tripartite tricarboxylate transporter substrate binding protein n=1 Tax=Ottowia thiooxydans TaxID=219182 RepID=UPI00041DC48A|nr:tripartite tricarboxylate transporter substrate binding protein [Ottowia thiooxydans]